MCARMHLAYLDDQAGSRWSGEMILHLDDQAGCCSGVEVLRKPPPITWLEEAQISFAALLLQMQLLFKLTTQDTQTHSHQHKNKQTHRHIQTNTKTHKHIPTVTKTHRHIPTKTKTHRHIQTNKKTHIHTDKFTQTKWNLDERVNSPIFYILLD